MKHFNLRDFIEKKDSSFESSFFREGQKYVLDYFQNSGKEAKLALHDEQTNTCFEKSRILGWDPQRVVKSIFLYDSKGKFYGFVSPELGESEDKPLRFNNQTISKIFSDEVERKKMMNLSNSVYPLGMEKGTCTPFVPEYYFQDGDGFTGRLERIFVYTSSNINKKLVDISFGGEGELAQKTSLHLTYEDIYLCLNQAFPGRITQFNFEKV
ncbi:MAG: hypothetical protein Q8Q04_02010 [archaeon]|nr:hypothetical protein [archaeon]